MTALDGVERLAPLKSNAYCSIHSGLLRGEAVIVKRYYGHDSTLARREAEALGFVAELLGEEPGWMVARPLRFEPEENTLVMTRLPGEPLADVIARAGHDRFHRTRALGALEQLGSFLARVRRLTVKPGAQPSPFLLEYLTHVSTGLEALPAIGPAFFRGSGRSAVQLWQGLVHSGDPPSWSHGDMVFRNLVSSGGRLGIIDLANTDGHAHVLNDVYALEAALESPATTQRLREDLRAAFRRGLGPHDFPLAVHRFYWELHRRRWLFLLLRSGNPKKLAQGVWSFSRMRLAAENLEPRRSEWARA